MSKTWSNDLIFTDFECSRCRGKEHKQIPKVWNDLIITEFFPNDFFCTQCGMHGYFENSNKTGLA